MMTLAALSGVAAHACTKEKAVDFKRACGTCISYKIDVKHIEEVGFSAT
jgi:hypothetical protein